ncbi:hypothetical protein [Exiguobacterium flavidum]|uniref:hypothetical protein n=1 Tax=Exiguobacterium flavidum TaxID=2184695 RepID=UPI000DF736C7|nr:hypothetical protein [Exiguobacterium flavidum]
MRWKQLGAVLAVSAMLAGCGEVTQTVDDAKEKVTNAKESFGYAGDLKDIANDTLRLTGEMAAELEQAAESARQSNDPQAAFEAQLDKLKQNGTVESFNTELAKIDERLQGLESPPAELQELSGQLEGYVNQAQDISNLFENPVSLDSLNQMGLEQAGQLKESISKWTDLLSPFMN